MARIMILLSVLMTANLWHKAQAQINPVISTVLGNGNGFAFFSVPQNPQTFLVPVAGVTGVNPGVAGGITGAGGLAGYPSYTYGYQVADGQHGDFHSHHESRQGNNAVGSYSLQEPTGNVRTVNYVANTNGFQAQVQNTAG